MTASFLKNTSLYRILTVIASAEVLTFLVFSTQNQRSEKIKVVKQLKGVDFFGKIFVWQMSEHCFAIVLSDIMNNNVYNLLSSCKHVFYLIK